MKHSIPAEARNNRNNILKIAAGIVLYNPNIERLKKCIEKIAMQIETIILFDNSTVGNIRKNIDETNIPVKTIYLSKGKNVGIATALNEIMHVAQKMGYGWVVTLDQDSLVPIDMIEKFRLCSKDDKLAILCPQVIDKRRKYMKTVSNNDISYVNFCITSASCTNISIWNELGGFDDWLFIDLVDNDYCKRIILAGYKIIKIHNIIVEHEFGEIEGRNPVIENIFIKLSKILQNDNIGKLSYKKKVDPLRVYYTNRNIVYLNNKFKEDNGIGYNNYNCKTYIGFLICFSLASFLRGKEKIKIFKAIINGIKDGKNKERYM